MRLNIVGNKVIVALSRGNIERLLEHLKNREPNRCIEKSSHGLELIVHAEENEEHYKTHRKAIGSQ